MEPRIQYTKTNDGVSIAYTSVGEGDPVVIAANIWGDMELALQHVGPIYGPLIETLLRNNFRPVVYDGRGSGSSERDVTEISQAARLADLEAVVDRLELDHFALLSVVHGGITAVGYAAKHPQRVTHLVLEAPYARGSEYYARAPALRAIKALSDMAEDNWEFFTLTVASWLLNFKDAAAAAELAATYRKTMDASDYRRMVAGFEQSDITNLLALVRAPTMVIQDATSPFSLFSQFSFVREVASGIEGAQLSSVQNRAEMADAIVGFLRGDKGAIAAKAPEGSLPFRTVLFTDLVAHTEMMSRLGDNAGRAVPREHERITREVLKAHGGTEIKTMGDGFLASFGSVTRAVECAIALQRAFAARNAAPPDVGAQRPPSQDDSTPDANGSIAGQHPGQSHAAPQTPPSTPNAAPSSPTHEPLLIRVGLNAGEPIEEDGDLFGATVILASRIAAKADVGEILVADTVRGLCSGKGFLFSDRGEFVAKGFEDPVRIYEVSWRE